MSDIFRGRTNTELYRFVSGGVAHTFTFSFQPDKVIFNNLTQWTGTADGLPVSVWWRDQTTTAHAFQEQVIVDNGTATAYNFLDTATNGFTVADTSGGVASSFALIAGVTQANPCVVTTTAAHGFQTNQIVMFTDLGEIGPGITARGMDQINNNRYRIIVIDSTSFSLKSIETDEPINSTSFTAWVSGGRVTLETHVITENNPQISPASYTPNPYAYDPVDYKLTAGTAVMGNDGDIFNIEVIKFGQIIDLADIG